MPIREIQSRYAHEWLLIKVLDKTADFEGPGILLAHGPKRSAMYKANRTARKADPKACLAITHGGKDLTSGEAFRRELARIAAEEEPFSLSVR